MNDDRPSPAGSSRFDVDADVFGEVVQAIGLEPVRESISTVVADIGRLMGMLSVGHGPAALDAVQREAHHLSGGCRSLGFVGIAAVCTRVEGDARERIDHLFPTYSDELAQQRRALIDWWSTASARYS